MNLIRFLTFYLCQKPDCRSIKFSGLGSNFIQDVGLHNTINMTKSLK